MADTSQEPDLDLLFKAAKRAHERGKGPGKNKTSQAFTNQAVQGGIVTNHFSNPDKRSIISS
jgi:hypothetical protein